MQGRAALHELIAQQPRQIVEELTADCLFLGGLLAALRLIRRGVGASRALDMGITNKAFDSYEQSLIRDVIAARIPAKLDRSRLFTD